MDNPLSAIIEGVVEGMGEVLSWKAMLAILVVVLVVAAVLIPSRSSRQELVATQPTMGVDGGR